MKENMSVTLMAVSLVALAVFLGFWLKKSYHEKGQNIKTELAFHVVRTSSDIKDSLIFKFLSQDSSAFHDGLKNLDSLLIRTKPGNQVFYETKIIHHIIDSPILESESDSIQKDTDIVTGSLPNQFNQKKDEDIQWNQKAIEEIRDSGKKPKTIKIIASLDTMVSQNDVNLFVKSKEFNHTKNEIDQFELTPTVIIRRMMPQILFSLFLFTSVCFSFWYVFRSLKELHKLNVLKNNFISNMTHELKTPISTVAVALEAMQNFDILSDKSKSKEYLTISQNELSRLSLLVDKVMNFNQMDYGKTTVKKEDLDFLDIVKHVSSSMKIQFEKSNALLHEDIKGNDFKLRGDSIHLTNVIFNLFDNALKYGGSHPEIKVVLQKIHDDIWLKISDNGLGISSEYLDKIFDKFFRVPQGDVHNIKGYGLGLSYVQQVIQQHGGIITVESKEHEGSTFTIKIPSNA